MGTTVADRLRQARRARFVGREAELELVRAALAEPEPPFFVLFVHGIGGVGKTALLGAIEDVAAQAGVPATRIDLREIEPSPPALLAAAGDVRGMLLLDTYESAAPLDGWLRERFLPGLPAGTLTVIAGREPPGPGWLADPGWHELLRAVALRNLPPRDAREYLAAAGIAPELHERVVASTHGHPLALVLHADVLARRPDREAPLSLADAPDVVRRLVERFVEGVPSERHRQALEVCAYARFTTEATLGAAVGGDDAPELLAWLRTLPFISEGARGAFPHDLVRDVLAADVRFRDPQGRVTLHRRVHDHVLARLRADERGDQNLAADLVFLHRGNPFTGAYWDWASFGSAYIDAVRPSDRAALPAMAEQHEGPESAALVAHWLDRQPAAFFVFRSADERPIGFAALLALHAAAEEDIAADPGARAMWAYARRQAPRPGEEVFAARFLCDAERHQAPSPSLNLVTVAHLRELVGHPRTGWELIGCWLDPDAIAPMMAYIEFQRAPEADYEVAGRRYGVFAHDWRRMDLERWLDVTSSRWVEQGFEPPAGPAAEPPALALSQPDFAAAVRAALRDLHRPEVLARSPLLRSRLIRDAGGGPEALQDVLEEAVGALRVDPRDAKLHRALARPDLRPAPTQEAAAEVLGLPFSTYRRHLTRGVERVAEALWQRELYGE